MTMLTEIAVRPVKTCGCDGQWVVEAGDGPTGVPLVVFPHAGAGPSPYRRLARALDGTFRPLIAHFPGRESRLGDPPCGDLSALVRALCRAVAPFLAGPFVFYGHSMGALVAFELARQLRRLYGIEPDHLVVSGRVAPRVSGRPSRHRLPDGELWESVCQMLGTPREVAADLDMRDLLLPALRADFQICDTYRYRPEPALDCPITSFAGDCDDEAPSRDMAGWAEETQSGYRHETLPGNHFFNLASNGAFAARLLHAIT